MKLQELQPQDFNKYVGLLTEQQKDQLIGQWYAPDSYFNPIQDLNDNWIISTEEMFYCVNPEFMWVKDLDLIIYEPKVYPFPDL
jgi:hypothetical protein